MLNGNDNSLLNSNCLNESWISTLVFYATEIRLSVAKDTLPDGS
jgi:hypothetical protein